MCLRKISSGCSWMCSYWAVLAFCVLMPCPSQAQTTDLEVALRDSMAWNDGLKDYVLEISVNSSSKSIFEGESSIAASNFVEICQLKSERFKMRRVRGSSKVDLPDRKSDRLACYLAKSGVHGGLKYRLGEQPGERIQEQRLNYGFHYQLPRARGFQFDFAAVSTYSDWVGASDWNATELVEWIDRFLEEGKFNYNGAQKIQVIDSELEADVFLAETMLENRDNKNQPTGKQTLYGIEICVATSGPEQGKIVRLRKAFGAEGVRTMDFERCQGLSTVEIQWTEFEGLLVPKRSSARNIHQFGDQVQYDDKADASLTWSPLTDESRRELDDDELWEANARKQLVKINQHLKRSPDFPLSPPPKSDPM